MGSQYESLEFITQSRRTATGRFFGPKIPGRWASASVPQAQSLSARVPSSAGRPATWNSTRPIGVMHFWARAFETFGTTEWSAYSTSPLRSAAVVFTHGIPPPLSCRASRSRTPVALPMSRNVSTVRSCSPLASRIAKKLVGVQFINVSGSFST